MTTITSYNKPSCLKQHIFYSLKVLEIIRLQLSWPKNKGIRKAELLPESLG